MAERGGREHREAHEPDREGQPPACGVGIDRDRPKARAEDPRRRGFPRVPQGGGARGQERVQARRQRHELQDGEREEPPDPSRRERRHLEGAAAEALPRHPQHGEESHHADDAGREGMGAAEGPRREGDEQDEDGQRRRCRGSRSLRRARFHGAWRPRPGGVSGPAILRPAPWAARRLLPGLSLSDVRHVRRALAWWPRPARARGRHDRGPGPPGPRRGGPAHRRARGPRPPPPLDHRPERGGPRADDERGRHALAGLQRGDLQLPRAARGARGPASLHEPGRRGGDPPPLRGAPGRRGESAGWDVRLCALGRAPATPAGRPRPCRQEAALLPRRGGPVRLRLGGEGAPRASGSAARAGPDGPAPLPDLRLRPQPRHVLPRHPRPAPRPLPRRDRAGSRGPGALLEAALPRRRGRGRPGGGGALPHPARAGGRPAAGGGRAARGLPLGRPRLVERGGAHGPERRRAGPHVHDRLRGPPRVRRDPPSARGGPPLRDRAHRVRGGAARARPDRSPGVAPRRPVRRLVGHSHLPALGADAQPGHGRAQRRRG